MRQTWLAIPLLVCILYYSSAIEEDERFIKKYGNEFRTSGVWDVMRRIKDDPEKLKNVSMQIFTNSRFKVDGPTIVLNTTFSVKTLEFAEHKPIKIDALTFTIDGRYRYGGSHYLHHVTKGQEADCVYFLVPEYPREDENEDTLLLHDHVCNITFPEP